VIAGLAVLVLSSLAPSAAAETEEERKAIEEIERKAEAEKKKALERIRKKAEAEKKKAAADAKKEAARAQKAEAEAKKKAERERKKEEERRKKEEREGKRAPEPPPPESPPAEPAPPTVTAPPVAPPVAPPPPEPLPEARPVDHAGEARWTGIGFVQKGEAVPAQGAQPAGAGALEVPSAMGALGMNRGYFLFGLGQARFNPINDDVTDDDTAFNLLDLNLRLGFEFRNLGSLLAPWFDLGPNIMFGSRKETGPTGTETGRKFNVFSMQWHGRFGMDLAPIDIVSAGPFIGYRMELYSVKLADDNCTTCSSEGGLTHGLMYGLHARVRTRAKPGEAERFYLDGMYGWRKGKDQTTSHVELEAAVRAGPIFFVGWYEKRMGSSGQIDVADAEDIGDLAAASMPIDQRLGLGMAAIF